MGPPLAIPGAAIVEHIILNAKGRLPEERRPQRLAEALRYSRRLSQIMRTTTRAMAKDESPKKIVKSPVHWTLIGAKISDERKWRATIFNPLFQED